MQKSLAAAQGEIRNKPEPRRARGRPRTFDRDTALTQAMRVFWAKGFSAASMADLTEAMGIGSPSLYAAFGSKEALYAEAIAHYVAQTDRPIWAGFDTAPSAQAAITRLLMNTAAILAQADDRMDPPGCMILLSDVGGEGQAALGELIRAHRHGVLARITRRLECAVADGELSASSDVKGIARFCHAVQGGLSLQARDGARRPELEAAARAAMAGWDAFATR